MALWRLQAVKRDSGKFLLMEMESLLKTIKIFTVNQFVRFHIQHLQ